MKPLSYRYDSSVREIEKLDDLPPNAKSFISMRDMLAREGVKWTSYARVQSERLDPKKLGGVYVVSGLQAVGSYNGAPVVIETKVGVSKASSGYLYQFGEDPTAGCVSSIQTVDRIRNKMHKHDGEKLPTPKGEKSNLKQRVDRIAKRGKSIQKKQDDQLRRTGAKNGFDDLLGEAKGVK